MDFKESKFFNQSVMSAAREKQRERDLILNSIQQLGEKLNRLEQAVPASVEISKDLYNLFDLRDKALEIIIKNLKKELYQTFTMIAIATIILASAVGIIIGLSV